MRESLPLEKLLLCAEGGISPAMYKKEAKNLFYICSSIFQRNYRIYVLEILVTALEAAIEHHIIKYRGIKLDYQSFAVNPSLFMCESADIFMDIIEEPLERIEFGEGPYDFAGITVEENDVVFDIGANFGLFSAVAASKARKGKVYAFEPVKETRKILKHTADLYDNIIIEPYAISNICGKSKIDLSTYDFNQGEASVMTVNGSSTKTDEVKTITLDQFVKTNHISRIDFIKADIEGAERLLLSGAKEVLQKFAPKLSLCTYHYPEDTALLEFIIKQANPNYVIEKAYHKLYAYVNK